MSKRGVLVAILALISSSAAVASAATIEGTVFDDRDGDGLFTAGDVPLAGCVW